MSRTKDYVIDELNREIERFYEKRRERKRLTVINRNTGNFNRNIPGYMSFLTPTA